MIESSSRHLEGSELAATVFALNPPTNFTNGRELLESLVHDCARACPNELKVIAGDRLRLVLSFRDQACQDPCGLSRFLALRFTVLWPRSSSPAVEVCGANCFVWRHSTDASSAALISTGDIHDRFPEAAQWVQAVSNISLKAHVEAVSTWFHAADRAGWNPTRLSLEKIESPDCYIQSGRGKEKLVEPFRSISIARTPVRSPSRIDLRIVSKTTDLRVVESIKMAFRRWWPMLRVSICHADIRQQPLVERPELSLLAIPAEEDVHDSPWIDWLRANEAADHLFKIVRVSSLYSETALTNLTFDLFMLAGGVPWTAVVGSEDETFLGLDAGHNRDSRWSRWVCARIEPSSNSITCRVARTGLAEHIPAGALEQIMPGDTRVGRATVFRDGRFHSGDMRFASLAGLAVGVAKSPSAVLYHNVHGKLRPAQFGDALRYPDGRVLMQTSSNREGQSSWKMPIRLSTQEKEHAEQAVSLTRLLCRQPALGVYSQPRLPSPVYWADLISKTNSTGWPKAVGRGLNLEAIIPQST